MPVDIVEGVECPSCGADIAREGIDGSGYRCTNIHCGKYGIVTEYEGETIILWYLDMNDFAKWNAERSREIAQ